MKGNPLPGATAAASVASRTGRGKRVQCDDVALQSATTTAAARTRRPLLQTAPRPTSWGVLLPPDLVGMVATFLDPASALDYAVTAGPIYSTTIKISYHKRNFKFLVAHAKRPLVYRAFLDANNDWRDLYDGPGLLSPLDRECFKMTFNDLISATKFGWVEVVKHLVEVRGMDINAPFVIDVDPGHSTQMLPLFLAILGEHVPMVEYMVGYQGLDINARVDFAPSPGVSYCVSYLHFALLPVVANTTTQQILSLLFARNDINVNITDEGGCTPLADAAVRSDADKTILPLLLSHNGIDIDAADNGGCTALHYAVSKWSEDITYAGNFKCLIEAGANIHQVDVDNMTPLDFATEEQKILINTWFRG